MSVSWWANGSVRTTLFSCVCSSRSVDRPEPTLLLLLPAHLDCSVEPRFPRFFPVCQSYSPSCMAKGAPLRDSLFFPSWNAPFFGCVPFLTKRWSSRSREKDPPPTLTPKHTRPPAGIVSYTDEWGRTRVYPFTKGALDFFEKAGQCRFRGVLHPMSNAGKKQESRSVVLKGTFLCPPFP